jgi:hypothetical protein
METRLLRNRPIANIRALGLGIDAPPKKTSFFARN